MAVLWYCCSISMLLLLNIFGISVLSCSYVRGISAILLWHVCGFVVMSVVTLWYFAWSFLRYYFGISVIFCGMPVVYVCGMSVVFLSYFWGRFVEFTWYACDIYIFVCLWSCFLVILWSFL